MFIPSSQLSLCGCCGCARLIGYHIRNSSVHFQLCRMPLATMLVHVGAGSECLRTIGARVQVLNTRMYGRMFAQHGLGFEAFVAHQTLVRRLPMCQSPVHIQSLRTGRHMRALITGSRCGRSAGRVLRSHMTFETASMFQPFAAMLALASHRFGAMLQGVVQLVGGFRMERFGAHVADMRRSRIVVNVAQMIAQMGQTTIALVTRVALVAHFFFRRVLQSFMDAQLRL